MTARFPPLIALGLLFCICSCSGRRHTSQKKEQSLGYRILVALRSSDVASEVDTLFPSEKQLAETARPLKSPIGAPRRWFVLGTTVYSLTGFRKEPLGGLVSSVKLARKSILRHGIKINQDPESVTVDKVEGYDWFILRYPNTDVVLRCVTGKFDGKPYVIGLSCLGSVARDRSSISLALDISPPALYANRRPNSPGGLYGGYSDRLPRFVISARVKTTKRPTADEALAVFRTLLRVCTANDSLAIAEARKSMQTKKAVRIDRKGQLATRWLQAMSKQEGRAAWSITQFTCIRVDQSLRGKSPPEK